MKTLLVLSLLLLTANQLHAQAKQSQAGFAGYMDWQLGAWLVAGAALTLQKLGAGIRIKRSKSQYPIADQPTKH